MDVQLQRINEFYHFIKVVKITGHFLFPIPDTFLISNVISTSLMQFFKFALFNSLLGAFCQHAVFHTFLRYIPVQYE